MRKLVIAGCLLAAVGPLAAQESAAIPGLVFFDWGKPELSGDAKATLEAVAVAYRQNPGRSLQLAGHTDRSGSAAVNRRSALRRAQSVSAYLASRGVPAAAMTVVSHGEERPLVATEDGVREAQNRRVEISLRPDSGM